MIQVNKGSEYTKIGRYVFDHGHKTINDNLHNNMVRKIHGDIFTMSHFTIEPIFGRTMSKLRREYDTSKK